MLCNFTQDNIKTVFNTIFPKCKDSDLFSNLIYKEATKREFSKDNLAMFLAQTGHETCLYTRFVENLNYSANGLYNVFRKYFNTMSIAEAYARQPEKIANKVYANRMGNGSACSGDGWKYRGRGLIQITGKGNYHQLSYETDINFLAEPDLLLKPEYAVLSAFWFWDFKKLKNIDSIEKCTKLINGGLNGFDERCALFEKIKKLLN